MDTNEIIFAAETAVHNPALQTLHPRQREGHVLLLGTSVQAKQDVLWNMMVQDIAAGAGVCVLDTTGAFADPLLDVITPRRKNQTDFFQPANAVMVPGFNFLRNVPIEHRDTVAQETVGLFAALWDLSYDRTPLLIDLLRATVRVLLDCPQATMISMYTFLTDEEMRRRYVSMCDDALSRRFWTEFEKLPAREKRDKPQSVLTRIRAFISDARLRNVVGQVTAPLDVDHVVRNGRVFLADLSALNLGQETSMMLGCLLASRFQLAIAQNLHSKPFYIYIPECQNLHAGVCARQFANTGAGGAILSVNQVGALDAKIRSGLLAAETLIATRVGFDDTKYIAPRFLLPRPETDLLTLEPQTIAVTGRRAEYQVVAPAVVDQSSREDIVAKSHATICARKSVVERKIDTHLEPKGNEKKERQKKKSKSKQTTRNDVFRGEFRVGETIFSTFYKMPVKIVAVTEKTVTLQLLNGREVEHIRTN